MDLNKKIFIKEIIDKQQVNDLFLVKDMRQAETKAANRAIRAFLGIKGAYTWDEAARPFVYPALMWQPDMTDPEVRRMVTATELGIVGQVYGGATAPVEAPMLADPTNVVDAPPPRQLPDNQAARTIADGPAPRERERVPVDNRPAWARDEEPAAKQQAFRPECSDKGCGLPLSKRQATYTEGAFGDFFCGDHEPGERGS